MLQTQNNSIDPTTAIVLTNRAYVVSPDRDKIIINEVLYSQSGTNNITSNDEFIELYNASAVSVDLSGWKLIDGNLIGTSAANDGAGSITGSAAPFVFGNPLGSGVTTSGTPILQPGQYAVIWIGAASNITTQTTGTLPTFQAWLGNSPKLNDNGDDIWLYDDQTRIVDYVTYGANMRLALPSIRPL